MAGYIGSKAAVTQVDGYTKTEAESRYANVTGDTFSGNVVVNDTITTTNIKATGETASRAVSGVAAAWGSITTNSTLDRQSNYTDSVKTASVQFQSVYDPTPALGDIGYCTGTIHGDLA